MERYGLCVKADKSSETPKRFMIDGVDVFVDGEKISLTKFDKYYIRASNLMKGYKDKVIQTLKPNKDGTFNYARRHHNLEIVEHKDKYYTTILDCGNGFYMCFKNYGAKRLNENIFKILKEGITDKVIYDLGFAIYYTNNPKIKLDDFVS